LFHELQHALDDWRSKGKIFRTKKLKERSALEKQLDPIVDRLESKYKTEKEAEEAKAKKEAEKEKSEEEKVEEAKREKEKLLIKKE